MKRYVLQVHHIHQRGVVLVIALVMLVAMTLAGITLVRSTDTANLIAGNFSFRQASILASEVGVEAAALAIPNIVLGNPEVNVADQYYATQRVLDARGVPTGVNFDNANSVISGDYTVNFVVERLCSGVTPVTNVQAFCVTDVTPAGGGSRSSGSTFTVTGTIYYRVTARITGPKNTMSYVQIIAGR